MREAKVRVRKCSLTPPILLNQPRAPSDVAFKLINRRLLLLLLLLWSPFSLPRRSIILLITAPCPDHNLCFSTLSTSDHSWWPAPKPDDCAPEASQESNPTSWRLFHWTSLRGGIRLPSQTTQPQPQLESCHIPVCTWFSSSPVLGASAAPTPVDRRTGADSAAGRRS